MKSAPLIYYPSTINWIDDDSHFLKAISTSVKTNHSTKTYQCAIQCLTDLKKNTPTLLKHDLFTASENNDNYGLNQHIPTDINLSVLPKLRQDKERYNEVSVVIVDYNMPGMDGLDFCRELKDSPIKKILLTGLMNNEAAVQAFNEGIIHCFLQKDSPTLANDLEMFINQLSLDYFTETTKPLITHLSRNKSVPQTDLSFVKLFDKWKILNEITEYYIFDTNCSVLGYDKNGLEHHLVIHTDKSLDAFTELHDDTNLDSILTRIKNRNAIPFFGVGKESWEFETSEWEKHLLNPSIIEGNCRYYYWSQHV